MVSNEFCASLEEFYADLLDFFGALAKIFVGKAGSKFTTPLSLQSKLKKIRASEHIISCRSSCTATIWCPLREYIEENGTTPKGTTTPTKYDAIESFYIHVRSPNGCPRSAKSFL